MSGNANRILTTHVGSLVRPPKLIAFWRAIEDGKPYDEAAFEACLTESVAEVARRQAEIGIDIVSDGEFSKGANWAFYVHKRLSGIAVRPRHAGGGQGSDGLNGRRPRPRGICGIFMRSTTLRPVLAKAARQSRRRQWPHPDIPISQVLRDIKNLEAGVAAAKGKHRSLAGFLPVVAPARRCRVPRTNTTRMRRLTSPPSPTHYIGNTRRSSTPVFTYKSTTRFCHTCTSAWYRR